MQIGVKLGTVFYKCDSSHVLLLFIDVLMNGFGKYFRNSVNNLWFSVKFKFHFLSIFNLVGNNFGGYSVYSC